MRLLRTARTVKSKFSSHQRQHLAHFARRYTDAARFTVRHDDAHQLARELLEDYPVGEYPLENWMDAEDVLYWFASREDAEKMKIAFQMFDRLLEELERQQQQLSVATWLDELVISRMVESWHIVWIREGTEGFSPQEMLQRILAYEQKRDFPISQRMFYWIMHAAYKRGDVDKCPEFAEKVIDLCTERWKNGNQLCRPTGRMFNLAMKCWATKDPKAAPQMQALFDRMMKLEISVNSVTYDHLLEAWSQTATLEGALKCQDLLKQLLQEYNQGALFIFADAMKFTTTISAWARSGVPYAGEKAEAILEQMEKVCYEQNEDIFPIRPAYNATMQAHANAGTLDAAAKAERLFNHMYKSEFYPPCYISYLAMINVWTKAGKPDKANHMLHKLIRSYFGGRQDLRPDSQVFSAVINAWSVSNRRDKLKRVYKVFSDMERFNDRHQIVYPYMQPSTPLKPTIQMYNALLNCLAKTPENTIKSTSEDISIAEEAEKILMQLRERAATGEAYLQPDQITYTTVMRAWAVNAKDPERAAEILKLMIGDYLDGNKAAKPDSQAYNTVLSSFMHSDRTDAPALAEAFFDLMVTHYQEQIIDFLPNVYTYGTVIACLAKASQFDPAYAQRAETLFRQMKKAELQPSAVCYNSLINAWAEAMQPDRADAILLEMYEDYVNGNSEAKPVVRTFNTVLKAWAKAKRPEAAQKADKILGQMKELHQSGMHTLKPDVVTYREAIKCFYVSKQPGSPQRAEALLRKMESLYEKGKLTEEPKHMIYNVVRKAWKFSFEPERDVRSAALEEQIKERYGQEILDMYVNYKPLRRHAGGR